MTARVASGLVIAPFLLFASALTPLPLHEPATGHSHAFVHSHFESHHLASYDAYEPEFEQGPERVVWLENAILHQPSYHGDPWLPSVVAGFDAIAFVSTWSPISFDDGAPVHGPPRRHLSFRGPPLLLA